MKSIPLSVSDEIEAGEKDFNINSYDYHMWLNAQSFITRYPKKNETIIIYTHYDHAKKREGVRENPNNATMGRYLENYFKEEYSVVGLIVGIGKISTREKNSGEFTDISIEKMASGSIEEVCILQEDINFYYPSDKLPYNVYPIRNIGNREALYSNNYIYSLLKANINGFIFFRNSNCFNRNHSYDIDYNWNKAIKRSTFLKEHEVKNK